MPAFLGKRCATVVPVLKVNGCYAPEGADKDQAFVAAIKKEAAEEGKQAPRKPRQGGEKKTQVSVYAFCVPCA